MTGSMINRTLAERIAKTLPLGKVIVIYGARQVGKSSLLKMIWGDDENVLWLNGEELQTRSLLEDVSIERMRTMLSGRKTIIIDEAQNILNIGLQLKRLKDNMPEVQIIATGSSSFDLANKINEPMTGRKIELQMYALSYKELADHFGAYETDADLEQRLVFGSYPEVVCSRGMERDLLANLSSDYLYKDILTWGHIKKSERLIKLLQALALQIGSQVSYTEIGNLCGLDNKTVERYISVLEQAFIIFRLPSFARNMRNELKFGKKIYFYDLGIRNALIGNFSPVELRSDVGRLWENFLVTERLKLLSNSGFYGHLFFWRDQQQSEIDLLEEEDGHLRAYEFKWNAKRTVKVPAKFATNYPDASFSVITRDNYHDFLTDYSPKNILLGSVA